MMASVKTARSLRSRMLLAGGATIVLCWGVALAVLAGYFALSQSSIEDKRLRGIAHKILQTVPVHAKLRGVEQGEQVRADALAQQENLAFQVWVFQNHRAVGTPGSPRTPLRPDFVDGFASTMVEGQRWRVYSVSDSTGRITVQVGNLHSQIDAELRKKALIAMAIATALLVLIGSFMGFAVRRALLPVAAMEAI